MSSRRLKLWLAGAVALVLLYGTVFIVLDFCGAERWSDILESLIPLFLGLPLAAAVYAFNRRNSYLQALRQLWATLVPAAQEAIQYTHLPAPSQAEFAQTQKALSTAIDGLRGVFENTRDGLYPYENLKDIKEAISWLGFGGNFNGANAQLTRRCVVRLWQEMHAAMLAEFDRDRPKRPVSKYLHWRVSVADLLQAGTLTTEDLDLGRSASNPQQRPHGP